MGSGSASDWPSSAFGAGDEVTPRDVDGSECGKKTDGAWTADVRGLSSEMAAVVTVVGRPPGVLASAKNIAAAGPGRRLSRTGRIDGAQRTYRNWNRCGGDDWAAVERETRARRRQYRSTHQLCDY